MDGFVNNTAKLCWLAVKYASKEEKLGLLMLYSAIQHPEAMKNMLPYYDSHLEDTKEF